LLRALRKEEKINQYSGLMLGYFNSHRFRAKLKSAISEIETSATPLSLFRIGNKLLHRLIRNKAGVRIQFEISSWISPATTGSLTPDSSPQFMNSLLFFKNGWP
jgi:hypothetical protein